jgi:multidrug resistance protein, MATE family
MDVTAPENATAVAIATTLLGIAALFQIFDASQATLANMLRGVHDSRIPLLMALLGYWAVGAPVGLVLGFLTPLGAVGVWVGLALGLAVVAILLLLRWIGKERRGFEV